MLDPNYYSRLSKFPVRKHYILFHLYVNLLSLCTFGHEQTVLYLRKKFRFISVLDDFQNNDPLMLDVIHELNVSLEPVWDHWMEFGLRLRLTKSTLQEINEAPNEEKFQMVLASLMGTITKAQIMEALANPRPIVSGFAEEWTQTYTGWYNACFL